MAPWCKPTPIVSTHLPTPAETSTFHCNQQVKFREFLSTEYGEAQLDFLLEAMKLEKLDAGEQDQAATKVLYDSRHVLVVFLWIAMNTNGTP